MNVQADFQIGQVKNALVVPTAAVVRQNNGTGVFVMGTHHKPEFTLIKTGVTVDNFTEVKSGLKGNEKVLISFPPGLKPQSVPRGGMFPGMEGGRHGGGASRGY